MVYKFHPYYYFCQPVTHMQCLENTEMGINKKHPTQNVVLCIDFLFSKRLLNRLMSYHDKISSADFLRSNMLLVKCPVIV